MNTRSKYFHRRLRYEALERRQVLSAATPAVLDAHVDGLDGVVNGAIPGDYNRSGTVGFADLQLWKETYGQTVQVAGQGADGNLDGIIDAADYSVWRDNLGRSLEPLTTIELADGSFIVRHADANSANSLIVPAGETVTLDADSSFDYIEVFGTLRVSRNYDTTLRFIDLIVFKGGELDMGTVDDPVLRKVDFIVKDVAIDIDVDPYQFGNGIFNFGEWHAYGRQLDESWTTLTTELQAGDTEIVRADAPAGWEVGDELLIPDTAQITNTVRRESTVKIAAIDGNRITLDKPLDFEHLAVRDPSGNVRLMPYVANVTRNIVIRSENPAGTRGHTIQLEQSEADVRYVSFLGLGRTLAEPLSSAVVHADGPVTPGTNQVARYPWHWHHVHPDHHAPEEHPHSGHLVGTYFDGDDTSKWGIVIHGTSDMHVADNITNRFTGAGIVTEDGNEFRNVIEGNFATGSFGYGQNRNSKQSMSAGIPGGEGAGFWFHGSENVIRDNVAVNNRIGYATLNMFHPKGIKIGSVPIEFTGNVALSNVKHGLETWRSPLEFEVLDNILANNGQTQLFLGDGELGSITVRDSLLLAQGGVSVGIQSAAAYSRRLEVYSSEILGTAAGIKTLRDSLIVKDTILQNKINFDWTSTRHRNIATTVLENVISKGLPGLTLQHIETGELSTAGANEFSYTNNKGYRVLLVNWQNEGKDYIFFRPHTLPSNPAIGLKFEEGLTLGEAWDRYGVGIDGGPVPDSAVPMVDSDGYLLEYSGEPQVPLPVSRWVLLSVSPLYAGTQTRFTLTYTGMPADYNTQFEIDGQLVTVKSSKTPYGSTYHYFKGNVPQREPGEHTVRTWRTIDGEIVEGSELEFRYFVADAPSA